MDSQGIVDALASHAAATGLFETVNGHEPRSAPGRGLTCAVWVDEIEPARGASGLQATSARLVMQVRIFAGIVTEPQDAIDPRIMAAADRLMAAYSGDFDLGGLVRNVDLLGQTGQPMRAKAGYITVSGQMYRVMDLTVPMIVNDAWEQVP